MPLYLYFCESEKTDKIYYCVSILQMPGEILAQEEKIFYFVYIQQKFTKV